MPLIQIKTSVSNIKEEEKLLKEISQEISTLTRKPEKYVMASLETNIPMIFSGEMEDCCFVEVKSIGNLDPTKMTQSLCNLLEAKTGIRSNRIYINFEDIKGKNWGYNGSTFG